MKEVSGSVDYKKFWTCYSAFTMANWIRQRILDGVSRNAGDRSLGIGKTCIDDDLIEQFKQDFRSIFELNPVGPVPEYFDIAEKRVIQLLVENRGQDVGAILTSLQAIEADVVPMFVDLISQNEQAMQRFRQTPIENWILELEQLSNCSPLAAGEAVRSASDALRLIDALPGSVDGMNRSTSATSPASKSFRVETEGRTDGNGKIFELDDIPQLPDEPDTQMWARPPAAARMCGVTVESLANARCNKRSKRTPDKMAGIDVKGRVWRCLTPVDIWYLVSSLPSKSPSRPASKRAT